LNLKSQAKLGLTQNSSPAISLFCHTYAPFSGSVRFKLLEPNLNPTLVSGNTFIVEHGGLRNKKSAFCRRKMNEEKMFQRTL
jgi:hypothetical protein